MPGTFAEWIAWPDRTVVFLAELTPRLVLTGWAAVGAGAPNTYQVALPRFVQTAHVSPVGMYRRCVGARINDSVLTEQASLAAVDAAAGSWYWDESAALLYVRTPGGGDPDTYTVAMADVTFYMATTGIVLNRVAADPTTAMYYLPWLPGDSPTLEAQIEDLFFGMKQSPTGDMALLNGHGAWHQIIATDGNYSWKNATVRFFVGGSYRGLALTRDQYVATMTMLVEDVAANEERVVFRLKPLARALNVEIPVTPFFESEYPNLGDGVRGLSKPVGYGRATMAPYLTDTSSHGVYTVADAAYQTLSAVHQVQAVNKTTGVRTTLSEGVDYSVDLTACTITILSATYRWQDYTLEIDVTGRTETTFGAIVPDLLQRFAGVRAADIDTAAFATAAADAPEEISMWLLSPRTLGSILASSEPDLPSLEPSVFGTVQQTLAGLWTGWIWDPSYDSATIQRLRKEDFARFDPEPKLESIYWKTLVHFNKNHARGEWAIEQDSDQSVQYKTGSTDVLRMFTFLRAASAANILAQRCQLIAGHPTTEIEFEERSGLLVQHLPGDKVLVTYDPAPTADGQYTDRVLEIIRLGKRYAPDLTIVGRFGDLRGVGESIGHWTAGSAPTWAASDSSERANQGYWCDTDGRTDSADPSTAGKSIWW